MRCKGSLETGLVAGEELTEAVATDNLSESKDIEERDVPISDEVRLSRTPIRYRCCFTHDSAAYLLTPPS